MIPLKLTHPPSPSAKLRPELEVGSYLLGSRFAASGDGQAMTLAGSISTVTSRVGLAWVGDATDNIAYCTPKRNFVVGTDTEMTLCCIFRAKTIASADQGTIAAFGATGGGGGNTLFRMYGGSSLNTLLVQIQDSAGTVFYGTDSSAAATQNGEWHTAVVPLSMVASATLEYWIDGDLRGTVTRTAGSPAATTFNVLSVCALRRGGSTLVPGNYDVALFVPIFLRMSSAWCAKASRSPMALYNALFKAPSLYQKAPGGGGGFLGAWVRQRSQVIGAGVH